MKAESRLWKGWLYMNTGWKYREIKTSTNRSRVGVIGKCVALGINGKTWDKRVLKINIT